MENISAKQEGAGAATIRFRAELKAFLESQLGLQGPAVDKVAEMTVSECKKNSEKNNLDDLNDFAKVYLFSQHH